MSVKQKFNILEKKIYGIRMILVDFCENFPWYWLFLLSGVKTLPSTPFSQVR